MPKTTPSAMHRSLPDLEAAREADLMDRARGAAFGVVRCRCHDVAAMSLPPTKGVAVGPKVSFGVAVGHLWPMRVPRRGAPAGVGGRT